MSGKIPRGLYGPNRDGLQDPGRFSIADRVHQSLDRVAVEKSRRESPSPVERRLQAATNKALGRGN